MGNTKFECAFWKFVSHPVSTTSEQAAALARRIETGEFVPPNQYGERYWRSGGWCYDVGRKPFIFKHADGHIGQGWARSIKELREACYLGRAIKVVPDPFYKADADD